MATRDIYSGKDPSVLPAYSLAEVSSYLRIHASTLRFWFYGDRNRGYPAVIRVDDPKGHALSFRNLTEAHVLGVIRREHKITLPLVRAAVKHLQKVFGTAHPFFDKEMASDGKDLFVETLYGKFENVSSREQMQFMDLLTRHLKRIDRNPLGVPIRLFPYSTTRLEDESKPVVINPRVQFGRPCLAGTGIAVDVLLDRWRAGEALEELATDYARPVGEIEKAIRFAA